MKELNLSKNKISLLDDEDYEKVISSPYKWYAVKGRHTYYAIGNNKGNRILLHRFILQPLEGLQVDHINRNGLDNRKENLRIATRAVNRINSITTNSTGYRGVYKDKRKNRKWAAFITVNRISRRIGTYDTAEEAALAYNNAAIKYFGDYATINDL